MEKTRGGEAVATEEHRLSMRGYFRDEILLLLERAGLVDVDVRADYTDAAPTAESEMLVFVARRRASGFRAAVQAPAGEGRSFNVRL